MLEKDKTIVQDFAEAIQNEWLETNGLGGWSGSTIIGCNTRRYHGLLVAATVPPAERMALVSKLDETIIIGNEKYELGTNNYGAAIHPNGFHYLSNFTKEFFPEFIYEIGGIKLKKTIGMIHGENTVVMEYEVLEAPQSFTMELLPLLSVRGYHSLAHENEAINRSAKFENDTFSFKAYEQTPTVYIKVPEGSYNAAPDWFYNFNYSVEQYRGLDFTEDLFTPGKFSVELKRGSFLGIIVSTENPQQKDAHELLLSESLRKRSLLNNQPKDELTKQLVLAADQFIVRRGEDLKTVIAGYHWFTDWGRDTMISLPGLCLSTGRYEDAKKILSAFAKSVSKGMLPNRFQDNGEDPEYNNVDGTLWYFIAVYKYLQATNDKDFVLQELLPVLKDIVDWHFKGTRYNIHVDDDGLLYAGESGQQLTWMDARIGNWVVTPRMGKPVEIQALWYNTLKIFSELLKLNNQENDSCLVNASAEKAKQSFNDKFWYSKGNYLYDVIDENGNPNNELRPNQLFAISLPFALIEGEKAGAVIKVVEEHLYTSVGLKSLPKEDVHYVPVYGGDAYHRDSSYHEGTVWSWLLGPYVDAIMKVYGSKEKAQQVIKNFSYHLNEGCIGSVSEIFDADEPHHPRGCVAQAWGVAEILRVIKEYRLYNEPKKPLNIKEEEMSCL
ncbi:MAG: amylo-alpha-1,6-glucosidase [Bacteroidota bacterium]